MKCQSVNTGIMAAFKERDEMVAIFTGHDHKNDFAVDFDKVLVGYTRKTGYGSYGPADGKLHGGRILKVKEEPFGIESYIIQEDGSVDLRYFTPAGEVELCGHATIAAFALLRRLGRLSDGRHIARTKAGELQISVDGDVVWMDMAPPRWLGELTRVEWEPLYRAFGLTGADRPRDLTPQIVSTGLADIMMPVRDRETLLRARQNETLVAELSRRQKVTGVHMFCLGDDTCTAWCSNFAPLYDIPEECATGTSNGALTYYLYRCGLVQPDRENVFLQGEHMRRPSEIRSRLTVQNGNAAVRVGGRAVLSLAGEIFAE